MFASEHERPPSLVVGADTVVVCDGTILEKPTSTEDARRMLRDLSAAGTHRVCTAVSLIYGGSAMDDAPHEHTFVEETTVAFRSLDEAEIEAYVASGEPMDKAGAYAIQGLGGVFVERIEGAGRLQRVETRDLGVKKRDRWYQLAFKRPEGD